MQIGENLEFSCIKDGCNNTVRFSIFDISKNYSVSCSECGNEYKFTSGLLKEIAKFESLCRAIVESEDILSSTNVSIDVGGHNVKIPFRLLLTRLNTQLDLDMNGKQIGIKFRLMPLQSTANREEDDKSLKVQSG